MEVEIDVQDTEIKTYYSFHKLSHLMRNRTILTQTVMKQRVKLHL